MNALRQTLPALALALALSGCVGITQPVPLPPPAVEQAQAAEPTTPAHPTEASTQAPVAVAEPTPAQTAAPTPELPTAEVFSVPEAPRPSGQQPQQNQSNPQNALPAASWAAQELARRGFTKDPTRKLIILDPGHGGAEVGAASGNLAEKAVNLSIAYHLKALLEAEGYQVLLTREDDGRAYEAPSGANAGRSDLQARVDIGNAARGDLWISIHNNGAGNTAEAGTEVWWATDRPFSQQNYILATHVQNGILAQLAAAGYQSPNRGLKDGSRFRVFGDRVLPLFVLGNPTTRAVRATQMPGILGESLFLSNPVEANLLRDDRIRFAIAVGYLQGIKNYYKTIGG